MQFVGRTSYVYHVSDWFFTWQNHKVNIILSFSPKREEGEPLFVRMSRWCEWFYMWCCYLPIILSFSLMMLFVFYFLIDGPVRSVMYSLFPKCNTYVASVMTCIAGAAAATQLVLLFT